MLIATIVHRSRQIAPFGSRDENGSYARLASLCARRGIDLHLTHFENLTGAGSAFAWAWRDSSWQLVDLSLAEVSLCYADLPQNYLAAGSFRRALQRYPITIVNPLGLSELLTDKLTTHDTFEDHVPLTLSTDTPDLEGRLRCLRIHPDLSVDRLFLKPRFGERGQGIFVTDLEGLAAHSARRIRGYVVQAFLETRSGAPEVGIEGRHDLRLIVRDGEIVLAFARLPESGSLVSNCSQGGREVPLAVSILPEHITRFAKDIDARLRHFGPRLYSLDLGIGRSGKLWIYELNTMPGIVWDSALPENKPLHRRMHELVADWLNAALRHQDSRTAAISNQRAGGFESALTT